MNNILPFYQLETSMQFQLLCADLLIAEGCQNVRGIGTGADQGRDILVDVIMSSPLGDSYKRFIVQCKWYKSDRTVGQDEVSANIDYLQMHNASGILFITSSLFSGTAITKMESLDQSVQIPYHVKYWDGAELTRRLKKHASIIGKYWQNESTKKITDPKAILT